MVCGHRWVNDQNTLNPRGEGRARRDGTRDLGEWRVFATYRGPPTLMAEFARARLEYGTASAMPSPAELRAFVHVTRQGAPILGLRVWV